ncbi:MAG: glycosyltransferase [Sphingobacterium sp.]
MNSNVPKTIHQIVGPNTTPLIDRCLQSWNILKEYGFEIKVWNDDSIEEFILNSHPFAMEAVVNARNHAEASDIARYLIVYVFGGYYVDWDVELLDAEGFLSLRSSNPNGYMLIDPPNLTLASEYFNAAVADSYLLSLTQDIVELYNNEERHYHNTPQYSGPYRMRDSLAMHNNTRMNILPVKQVFAFDYREIRNPPDKPIVQPLIHYWVHSWIPRN